MKYKRFIVEIPIPDEGLPHINQHPRSIIQKAIEDKLKHVSNNYPKENFKNIIFKNIKVRIANPFIIEKKIN